MNSILSAATTGSVRPAAGHGLHTWLRQNFFRDWINALGTVAVLAALGWLSLHVVDWALLNAVFAPDNKACRSVHGQGACWGVIIEKGRLILFGRYPFDQQWRPLSACFTVIALLAVSALRAMWRPRLVAAWAALLIACVILMRGGLFGLTYVETARWGGLPLTLGLSVTSLSLAFPVAILVALGRVSTLPAVRTICTIYVEMLRGLPLISVLFVASVIIPLMLPHGMSLDVLLRVLLGMTFFSAANLAEVVRAGLLALPIGQTEAAQALGLSYWQRTRKIALPQALRMMVPAIVNTFVVAIKDTSLVTVVSLYDLTGSLQLALGDANWRLFFLEGQLFVAALYFTFCFSLSRYSRWVEAYLHQGMQRP